MYLSYHVEVKPQLAKLQRLRLALGLLGIAAVSAVPAFPAYIGHPKLLFTSDDLSTIQSKVQDGGADDDAYNDVLAFANAWLFFPDSSLMDFSNGLDPIRHLLLAGHVEDNGSSYLAKVHSTTLELATRFSVDEDEFSSALRLRALALGYDAAYADATPAERQTILDEIISYLEYMPTHFNYFAQLHNPYVSNHGITVGTCIGLAVIGVWEDLTASQRNDLTPTFDFGNQLIDKGLSDLLGNDGSYKEGVLYGGWIMRMLLPYTEARLRFDGFDYLQAYPKIAKSVEWLSYEILPEGDGRTNNLNDALWDTRPLALHSSYLDWIQSRLQEPLGNYLYDHVAGRFGYEHGYAADKVATVLWHQVLPPVDPQTVLPSGKLFADRGLYYYRNGWKSDSTGTEICFSFYSGKFFGGHAQEDQNQFTLYAYGDRYALDSGAAGVSATPKQTESHNLVLIDGVGQHNAGNSVGTDGNMASSLLTPQVDYLRGDAKQAYDTYSPFNAPGVPFPGSDWSWAYDGGNPVLRADRLVLTIKHPDTPPYFIIADDILKDGGLHTYEWLFHTDAGNFLDLNADPLRISAERSFLDLYFATAVSPAFSSELYDHEGDDPVTLRLSAQIDAVEPRFLTALVPCDSSFSPPAFSSHVKLDQSRLALDWINVVDEVSFNPDRALTSSEHRTDAVLSWVRSQNAIPIAYGMYEGSTLSYQNTLLASSPSVPMNMVFSNTVLHLERDDVQFTAYAPGITQVVGPNGPIVFTMNGDYASSVTTDASAQWPLGARLLGSHPNPFHPATTLRFFLPQRGPAVLGIFDATGKRLRTLRSGLLNGGFHLVSWDGRDEEGRQVASGVYFVRLQTTAERKSVKIVLLR